MERTCAYPHVRNHSTTSLALCQDRLLAYYNAKLFHLLSTSKIADKIHVAVALGLAGELAIFEQS